MEAKNQIQNLKSKIQNLKIVQEKYIDENKQGEAFAIAEKPENTKKLFLESFIDIY